MAIKPRKTLGRHEADRRALRLYAALREMEQMPLISVTIYPDNPKPILVKDKNDPDVFSRWSVDGVLMRDIAKAKAAGGKFKDLLNALRAPAKPTISHAETARAYEAYVTGAEEDVQPE